VKGYARDHHQALAGLVHVFQEALRGEARAGDDA